MKIYYAASSELEAKAANAVQVVSMCSAFVRAGHEVTLFAAGKGRGEDGAMYSQYGVREEFDIVRRRRPQLRLFGALWLAYGQARGIAKMGLPDLVYARNCHTALLVGRKGIPLVYESHNAPGGLRRIAEGRLLGSAGLRRLVVISGALRDCYLAEFPWLGREQITVAHDGANVSIGGPAPVGIPRLRRQGVPCLGYTGHLYSGKGMEVVLRMAAARPGWDFHVVGGEVRDIAYWRTREPTPNVHFHGHVSSRLLPWYRSQFDIALLPAQPRVSPAGGTGDIARFMSPLKLFEYMSAGLPIIASDLPVLREVLHDGTTALLVSPTDIQQWLHAAERLLSEPEWRYAIGQAAKGVFLRQYTWDARVKRVLEGLPE
jgi:glycosyltransferase involved in cell wall biosynthesis